jgi:hypothetical protein
LSSVEYFIVKTAPFSVYLSGLNQIAM